MADCDKQLRAGEPRIEALTASNPSLVPAVQEGWQGGRKIESQPKKEANQLQIVSMTLQDGEEWVVGRRLREILSEAAKRRSA